MTVCADDSEILAVSPTSYVVQFKGRSIRLSARGADWILRTQAAQLLLSTIFTIRSLGHRAVFLRIRSDRVDLVKRGRVHCRDSMEHIGICIQDIATTVCRLNRSASKPFKDLYRVCADKLAGGMVVLADQLRLLVSTDSQNSNPTTRHDFNPAEAIVLCDPSFPSTLEQALSPK